MSLTRPRRVVSAAAVLYVCLITAAGLAHGMAGGGSYDNLTALYFLTFPGSLLVMVFVLFPLAALFGAGQQVAEGDANPFGSMVYLTGGALMNVLLLWAVVALVRSALSARRAC